MAVKPELLYGNKEVVKEAKKRKRGGKVVREGYNTGGTVRMRLDRPGRKRGGRALADAAPLSTAHRKFGGHVARKGGGPGDHDPHDAYGGERSD